jgi:glycerol-3-phosphate dehydrogenase
VGRHRRLGAAEVLVREPALARAGLVGGAASWDAATDDSRLTLTVALAAERAGAIARTRAEVTAIAFVGGRAGARVRTAVRDAANSAGGPVEVRARVVVNCAGPWADAGLDAVRARRRPASATYSTPPTTTSPTPTSPRRRGECVGRVAPARRRRGRGGSGSASREHAVHVDPRGLVTATGGKLTTYRRMAADVVDACAPLLGGRLPVTDTGRVPLPGGDVGDLAAECARAEAATGDAAVARRLVHAHGGGWPAVWALAADDQTLGVRVDPALPYVAAERRWPS